MPSEFRNSLCTLCSDDKLALTVEMKTTRKFRLSESNLQKDEREWRIKSHRLKGEAEGTPQDPAHGSPLKHTLAAACAVWLVSAANVDMGQRKCQGEVQLRHFH
jgi:hypothetical protein